ncbi:MAG: hypothetical protein ACYC6L_16050, partial [Anaerolineae bacterium]
MNFEEATRRFRLLEQQLSANQISLDQYRAGLQQCRVIDQDGRTWMPQERSGAWYVLMDGTWVQADPAQMHLASTLMQPPTPPPSLAGRPDLAAKGRGGMSLLVALIIWAAICALLVLFVTLVIKQSAGLVVVGIVALISGLIIVLSSLNQWEGRIDDIHTSTKRTRDNDGNMRTDRTTYAYVLTPDGKTKKIQS